VKSIDETTKHRYGTVNFERRKHPRVNIDLPVEYYQVDSTTHHHWDKFRLTGPKDRFTRELIQSRILDDHGAVYSFKYKYLYYYFVARYMRDNISESDVTETLKNIITNLHREDFANIIIFLSYLSRDRNLIDNILSTARQIFPETPPCNLEDHVDFLNRLMETVPQILLPDGDPTERRKQALRNLDIERENDRSSKTTSYTETVDDESQKKEIDEMMTFNRAFKSMQIMGQILRNFSGSLKGTQKEELVVECFSVGLRSLNALFGLLEKHVDNIIIHFSDFLGKNLEEMPQEKRIKTAKGLLFFLTELLCLGTIKRISFAVGSERLIPTYDDVQKIYDNVATEFVQTEIRMDHSPQFPEKRVLELKKKVGKNIFGETLLRMLVADHFYLFLRSYRVRQRVCQKLGIKPTKKMLTGSAQTKRKD